VNFPGRQLLQSSGLFGPVSPITPTVPEGHWTQAVMEVLPNSVLYLPLGQSVPSVGEERPGALQYLPRKQGRQLTVSVNPSVGTNTGNSPFTRDHSPVLI
jgi:hypothetical protein